MSPSTLLLLGACAGPQPDGLVAPGAALPDQLTEHHVAFDDTLSVGEASLKRFKAAATAYLYSDAVSPGDVVHVYTFREALLPVGSAAVHSDRDRLEVAAWIDGVSLVGVVEGREVHTSFRALAQDLDARVRARETTPRHAPQPPTVPETREPISSAASTSGLRTSRGTCAYWKVAPTRNVPATPGSAPGIPPGARPRCSSRTASATPPRRAAATWRSPRWAISP